MLGRDSDFGSRSIESNINAEKVTRNCIAICSFLIALATPFMVLSWGSRYEANENGFYKKELFKKERLIFEYKMLTLLKFFLNGFTMENIITAMKLLLR